MFPRPSFPIVQNDNSRSTVFPNLSPRFHDTMRPQLLQIEKEPTGYVVPPFENYPPMKLYGELNRFNSVNLYNPYLLNPRDVNFNDAARQVEQNVNLQPNNVVSASQGKAPRFRWTDEMHAKFVTVVDGLGGPWAAKPSNILAEMEDMGVSLHHIRGHLQTYRTTQEAELPRDAEGGKPTSKALSKQKQEKLLQEVEKEMRKPDPYRFEKIKPAGENEVGPSTGVRIPTYDEMMANKEYYGICSVEEFLKNFK